MDVGGVELGSPVFVFAHQLFYLLPKHTFKSKVGKSLLALRTDFNYLQLLEVVANFVAPRAKVAHDHEAPLSEHGCINVHFREA